MAQVNRKIKERKPPSKDGLPRPLASDLREAKSDNGFFDLAVTKARNARTGDMPMAFRRKLTKVLKQNEK